MAYQVQKINPLDLKPRKAIGVSLPFSGIAVFNSTYQSKDAIKTNLINFLLTRTGERYFNPEFGSDLRNQLFENISLPKLQDIKSSIRTALSIYFPRVIINILDLIGDPDTNSVFLRMKYSISDTNISNEEINIIIE